MGRKPRGRRKRDATWAAGLAKAASGAHNQAFREDLITYLFDYNAGAQRNMALLVGVLADNGYVPVEVADLAALRLAFLYLCEEVAVFVTNLPAYPPDMLLAVDGHLDTLLHAQAPVELREARRLVHFILGGTAPRA